MRTGYFIILALLALFLLNCNKDAELQPKDYPYVLTKEVRVNSGGVTFEANVLDYGKEEIIDFGFIWAESKNEFQISLIKTNSIDNFSTTVFTDIEKGINYTCWAYIRTNNQTVYANKVTFNGEGSVQPIIIDFSPKEGFDGTIIRINAKYLSSVFSNNKVFVNDFQAKIISISFDTITAEMPLVPFWGSANISVQVGNNNLVTSDKQFNIWGPVIDSVSSKSGYCGSTTILYGKNLTKNGKEFNVKFHYAESPDAIILDSSATKIEVVVPFHYGSLYNDLSSIISLTNGKKTITYNENYLIKKSWTRKQNIPNENMDVPLNPFVYQGKGYIYDNNSKDFYEYTPETDNWQVVTNSTFPGERMESGLFIVSGDKVYKAGGYNYTTNKSNELWEYNFTNNSWQSKNPLPFSPGIAIHFELNNEIYVISGNKQVWKCDFKNEQYQQLNNTPFGFDQFSFAFPFYVDGKLLVVVYGRTYEYIKESDTWLTKANNEIKYYSYSVIAVGFNKNNTGYVLSEGRRLYKYYYNYDKWVEISEYPGCGSAVSDKSVFTIDNKTYFAVTTSPQVECGYCTFLFEG